MHMKRGTILCALAVLAGMTGLLPAQTQVYSAYMTAAYEVPAAGTSKAVGNALAILDVADRSLQVAVTATGFGPAPHAVASGHIHYGDRKTNGGVFKPLTVDATGNGITLIRLSADEMYLLQQQNFYVNLHTAADASGAIRGQLVRIPSGSLRYLAQLSGAKEIGAGHSKATGMAMLLMNMDRTLSCFITTGSWAAGGDAILEAGIFMGGSKSAGTLWKSMTMNQQGQGAAIFKLTESEQAQLLKSELFVNIATAGFPKGAIRGQLEGEPGPSLQYVLSRSSTTGSVKVSPGEGPSVLDAEALKSRRLVELITQALSQTPTQITASALFDATEFPKGPQRYVAMALTPVVLSPETSFSVLPGLPVSPEWIPEGVSQADFTGLYLSDYSVSVDDLTINNVNARSYLFGPMTVPGYQFGEETGAKPSMLTAYNLTFKIRTKGRYLVTIHWLTRKTLIKGGSSTGSNLGAMDMSISVPVIVTDSASGPVFSESWNSEIPGWSDLSERILGLQRQAAGM